MPFGLTEKEHKAIRDVFRLYPKVEEVIIFGSRAMGTDKPGSDIDLAVKGRDLERSDIIRITVRLDELPLAYKYDVIDYASISNPELVKHIDTYGISFYQKERKPLDWKKFRLADLIEVKHGFAFKGEYISDRFTGDVILTPGNFKIGGGFKADKLRYYGGAYPEDYVLKEGDIVITMTDLSKAGDTLGYSAKIPAHHGIRFLHNQRIGLVKFKSREVDREFIYWLLRTNPYRSFIVGSATGSTVKHTSPSTISRFEFEAPSEIHKQRKIASILSSLDDKIELNLQMNQTLGAMAQAIFKEWFVDFRFPGFDGKLVDGLPKGWRVGALGEVLELQYGKALKAGDRMHGAYPVVGSNGVVGCHSEFLVNGPGIVIGRKGTIGEVIWLDESFFPIDTTFYVRDRLDIPDLYFHFYLLRMQDFKKLGSDSAVPGLNRNEALRNDVIIPNRDVVIEFNKLVKPMFKRKCLLRDDNQTLSQIRDSLLPKLMSGMIQVN